LASLLMGWYLVNAIGGLSSMSIGFYVAVLAALGVLGAAYIYRSPSDSIKSGFDSLKNDIEEKTKNTNNPS
jgi:hypothetical protein